MKQNMESPLIVVAVTSLAALLVVSVVLWKQKKRSKTERPLSEMAIPTKWTQVGEVGELLMYPLKGAKRKSVSEAQFTKIGLREVESTKLALQDRVFVVYNDKNEFMTTKKNTKMLFVETAAVDESSVKFSFPGSEDLIVKIPDSKENALNDLNFYFGEKVKTVDCGEEAAAWFSQRLLDQPTGLKLGCFIESLVPARSINGAYDKHVKVYTKLHSEYLGAYADIASYMLMSEESVNDLNSRLEKPVTEHNFRPNVMVKGSPAFSEDNWDWVRVGDSVVLRGFKYCTRCVVTTVNADTGEKDPKTEPLRTLRTYRQVKEPHIKKLEGSNPVMGMYAGCHRTGNVRVGDPVYVSAG